MMRIAVASSGLMLSASLCFASTAPQIELALPIDCDLGVDCHIQNFVDVDPSSDYADFTCGRLSYDGHKGTDFRLPSNQEMREGVAVLAAASGVVRAVRDGMDDISVREIGLSAISQREAGNAVVIQHPGGWETQYSHLRKGSLRVEKGQQVSTGDELGMVGLSGLTEFPHLHFSVRLDGATLDPFTGQKLGAGCSENHQGLWISDAQAQLRYQPSALLGAGFSPEPPKAKTIRDGRADAGKPSADWPALVFWVDLMGVLAGDELEMQLIGPDEELLVESTTPLERSQAQRFQFVGKRFREGLTPGTYTGRMTLWRRDMDNQRVPAIDIERFWVLD